MQALTHYQTYPERPPGADLPPKKVCNLDPMAPRPSMKAQAGTLAKMGCMIKVDCDDGAIDSVELFINFLAEEELADGYFMARVRARVPGFD